MSGGAGHSRKRTAEFGSAGRNNFKGKSSRISFKIQSGTKDYQIGGDFQKGKVAESNVYDEREEYLDSQQKRDTKKIVLDQDGGEVDFTAEGGEVQVDGDLKGTRIIDGQGKG